MLGIVNYPSISSVKSQKCSPAEQVSRLLIYQAPACSTDLLTIFCLCQGQVLGSLSAIQSFSMCIGPVIFNNSYALTTNPKGIAWMHQHWGFTVPEKSIWYVLYVVCFVYTCRRLIDLCHDCRYLGLAITSVAVYISFTIPDPADIYVRFYTKAHDFIMK